MVVSQPTTINLPALESVSSSQDETPGEFTQHLNAAFTQHKELKQLYAAALVEIEQLRKENAELRAGQRTQVIIDGKRFVLAESIHLVKDAMSDQQNGPKSELADSFIL